MKNSPLSAFLNTGIVTDSPCTIANGLIEFSSEEICALERAIQKINNEADKNVLRKLAEKLKIQIKHE